jgi:hypothetical protein
MTNVHDVPLYSIQPFVGLGVAEVQKSRGKINYAGKTLFYLVFFWSPGRAQAVFGYRFSP